MSRARPYTLGTALLVLLTSACGSEETPTDPPAPAQPDFSRLIPSCFIPHGSNPLIVSGDYTFGSKEFCISSSRDQFSRTQAPTN